MVTREYDKFKLMDSNRKINYGLVDRLVASISEIGYQQSKPIMVNKSFQIVDGQHRFEACKKLNMPVYYEITKNDDDQRTLILLNANQEPWRLHDYVRSYSKTGVKCYQELEAFEAKYNLGISNSVAIVHGMLDGNMTAKIRKGVPFKVNPNSEKVGDFILSCIEIVPYYKTVKFIAAITRLHNLATDEQIEKVKSKLISLPQQVNIAEYMVAFENILNRGKKPENKIILRMN